jgi:hypothetical protein
MGNPPLSSHQELTRIGEWLEYQGIHTLYALSIKLKPIERIDYTLLYPFYEECPL